MKTNDVDRTALTIIRQFHGRDDDWWSKNFPHTISPSGLPIVNLRDRTPPGAPVHVGTCGTATRF